MIIVQFFFLMKKSKKKYQKEDEIKKTMKIIHKNVTNNNPFDKVFRKLIDILC